MDYAIQLANMVQGQTGVNPPVGAVVVKEGQDCWYWCTLEKR